MSTSCLLPNHFPKFPVKSPCSSTFLSIKELSRPHLSVYLSDLGCILQDFENVHNLDKIFICGNHLSELKNRYYNRQRAVQCNIPICLSSHTNAQKHERRLNEEQVGHIFQSTGIVLPIGTGICHNCRHQLFRDFPNEVGGKKTSCGKRIETNNCQSGDLKENNDMCSPVKRAKRTKADTLVDSGCALDTSENNNTDSESQFSQETSLSQASEASVSYSLKLEALNKFLSLSGVSPIKECKVHLQNSSVRTQQRYINKAKTCFELMLSTVCPGEEDFIRSSVLDKASGTSKSEKENATLETLLELYKNAHSWSFQRQILSTIVKDKDFQEVKKLIPGLTRYRFKKAQEHIHHIGVGEPVLSKKSTREKYSADQLNHFVDFITSGQIIKDQPYGEKTLKLKSGEVITIPTVIRSLTPSTIISQYFAICNEENVQPLGRSTLYKILDECPAVVRKSVEGLDNFVMEGSRGFSELEKIINKLEISSEESKILSMSLQNAKTYLKSGLKAHASKESMVEDHCIQYALSTSEPEFSTVCNHLHSLRCQDCRNIDSTLETIKTKAEDFPWQNKEATMYMVDEAILAIDRWKAHIIRSWNQEQARSSIVQHLSNGDAIITCDWAMKFLPRKYREGQVDWFAKRGINWHIAVTLIKEGSHFSTLTHVHIFEAPVSQDALLTSQILLDVSRDLLHQMPALKNIHFFTDNAGCYKSSTSILLLHHELGCKVASFNFSEAQDGKGPCDRRAAHIKSIIRRYIDQGNDVSSAMDMKQAIDQEGKPDIKVKVASLLYDVEVKSVKCSIPGISKVYNFQYSSKGLRMWKAYSIGEGKFLPWKNLGCPSQNVELNTVSEWGQAEPRAFESKNDTRDDSSKKVFDCPVETCTRHFSSQKAVEDHILLGNCSADGHMNITDKAKCMYANNIMQMYPSEKNIMLPVEPSLQERKKSLLLGWAVKETRSRVPFSSKQKEFMVEKFNIGKLTGNKVDPYLAAEQMRMCGKFSREEFLSGQQISSFFSRLFQQDKKSCSADYEAAVYEESKDNLKSAIEYILS